MATLLEKVDFYCPPPPEEAVDKRALLFYLFLRPFTFPAIEAMKSSQSIDNILHKKG